MMPRNGIMEDNMKNKIIALLIILLSLTTCNIYAETKVASGELLTLKVNEKQVDIASYKVNNESYFMLRDIAYLLGYTDKKINIDYNAQKGSIEIIPGKEYKKTGRELQNTVHKKPFTAAASAFDIYYGDEKLDLTAYLIDNSNYLRLEDLALLLDISLVFDKNNKVTGINTGMPYDKEKHIFSPSSNVAILLYHHFTEGEPSKDFYYTTVSKEKFEGDMKILLASGYKSLSLENYYLNKYDKNRKYFVLTFDDGYLSNYDIAFDILKKHKIYADIFINTDSIDKDNRFKLNHAKEMEDSGFIKIYSHYPVHIDVSDINADEYSSMLKKSIETLESGLDKKDYYFFAYPYGFYNKEKYDLTKKAGYRLQAIQTVTYEGKDLIVRHYVAHVTNVIKLMNSIINGR